MCVCPISSLATTVFFIACFLEVEEEFISYHSRETYYWHSAETERDGMKADRQSSTRQDNMNDSRRIPSLEANPQL